MRSLPVALLPILLAAPADDYGYVSLVFAHASDWDSGFYLLNKDGEGEEDGGGEQYLLNSLIGLNAEALPPRENLKP